MKTKLIIYALAALTVISGTQAQSPAGNAVPVTADNYNRAQTDVYFGQTVKAGALAGLLQLVAFCFRTIKSWSGFAGGF